MKSLMFMDDRFAILVTLPEMGWELIALTIIDCQEGSQMPNINLCLPQFSSEVYISTMQLEGDPDPTQRLRLPAHANPPFLTSHADPVLGIQLLAYGAEEGDDAADGRELEVHFIIPVWVIRSQLAKHQDSNSRTDITIGWNQWGPLGCRIFEHFNVLSSYGTRYGKRGRDGFLHILDFNRFAVRKFKTLGSWEEGVKCRLVEDESVASSTFTQPCGTLLPYLEYTTQLNVCDANFFIAGEDSFVLTPYRVSTFQVLIYSFIVSA